MKTPANNSGARGMTLGQLTGELERALPEYKEAIGVQRLVEKLQTRLDELDGPCSGLEQCVSATKMLRKVGLSEFDRKTNSKIQTMTKKIEKIAEDFAEDPTKMTKANALCTADLQKLIEFLQQQLDEFWRGHVAGALPSDGVLAIFERYARYQAPVARIRRQKAALETLANNVPQSQKPLDKVRDLQEAVKKDLSRLPDLKPKFLAFLQNTVSPGVAVKELLDDAELLEWVRQHQLDSELRIRSGQTVFR